jgi:anthranilate phosphoribosyltransferase
MRHAAPVRTDIGVRTLFNLLGPLCNPASPTHQVLGVADASQQQLVADVLTELGCQGAWVVHGEGGLDEVSLAGSTRVALLKDGKVTWSEVAPSDFGLDTAPLEALRGGDAKDNAKIVQGVLAGDSGPRRDAVLINAAAALCATGAAVTPREGAERAAEAIDSGAARAKLEAWVGFH